MPTFGFSAFLKLLCLNERPQRREIRKRFVDTGDGYDFHRSLRLRAGRLMTGVASPKEILASLDEIARPAERKSAKVGLDRLILWQAENPGTALQYSAATYEAPDESFRVQFTPAFGIEHKKKGTAVHIWNTAKPNLVPRYVYAAMSLFPSLYRVQGGPPDDLAVLSLPDQRIYCLSDSPDHGALGLALVRNLELVFRDVRKELGLPGGPDESRPSPPPPPTA